MIILLDNFRCGAQDDEDGNYGLQKTEVRNTSQSIEMLSR
jgi:hypothetical protein